MNRKLISVLIANLFAVPAAVAQLQWSGEVSLGGIAVEENARDAAKLNEYRDLGSGLYGLFRVSGRSPSDYVDLFGENIGRDDLYLDLRGGRYGTFKYRLYGDQMEHNWAFGALTPYSGVGSDTLTATFPALNTATWNAYDLKVRRRDIGGTFDLSALSPWFVRFDANQISEKGLKLTAGSNGTSPGNGFTDKPYPVDFKTNNFSVEGGYASRQAQLSASMLWSRFSNDNTSFRWTNGFFGNQLDQSQLAPESDYLKFSVNGVLRQLPLNSTLAARISHAKTTSDFAVQTTALNTGNVFAPTNPDQPTFDGDVVHRTASLSLHSNPTREIDTRLYWNRFEKENNSSRVTFGALPAGLQCGGPTCTTHMFSYDKDNLGAEFGYRFNPNHRIVAGYDFVNLERDRIDFDETKDHRFSLEYRTSVADVGLRLKGQQLRRRSNFLEGSAGVNANDPLFLNRYIARFDASGLDQNLVKLGLDWTPIDMLDVGAEIIAKRNDYKDAVLGRTEDNRQEYYLSVGYGNPNKFRVLGFVDLEFVKYDSVHRNISTVSAGTVGINAPPAGFCQTTFPNCYDPISTPANTSNYNWGATNKDRSYALGFGADWTVSDRLKLHSSVIWQRTEGEVDFQVQPGGNTTNEVDIGNFDNVRRLIFNLRGSFAVSSNWGLTAGYSLDRFRYDDIAFNGYQYTIGTGASASYLSGWNAFTNYTAHIFYVIGTYRFQ